MREYQWKEFKIPNTPCILTGKNFAELKRIQCDLMDTYPEYEFKLSSIGRGVWQMFYSA